MGHGTIMVKWCSREGDDIIVEHESTFEPSEDHEILAKNFYEEVRRQSNAFDIYLYVAQLYASAG